MMTPTDTAALRTVMEEATPEEALKALEDADDDLLNELDQLRAERDDYHEMWLDQLGFAERDGEELDQLRDSRRRVIAWGAMVNMPSGNRAALNEALVTPTEPTQEGAAS